MKNLPKTCHPNKLCHQPSLSVTPQRRSKKTADSFMRSWQSAQGSMSSTFMNHIHFYYKLQYCFLNRFQSKELFYIFFTPQYRCEEKWHAQNLVQILTVCQAQFCRFGSTLWKIYWIRIHIMGDLLNQDPHYGRSTGSDPHYGRSAGSEPGGKKTEI